MKCLWFKASENAWGGCALSIMTTRGYCSLCYWDWEHYHCTGITETTWTYRSGYSIPVVPSSQGPTSSHVDNYSYSGIWLAASAFVNLKTKHIDEQYHYTIDCIAECLALLRYCHNDQVIGNMLTMQLGRMKPCRHMTDAKLQHRTQVLTQRL